MSAYKNRDKAGKLTLYLKICSYYLQAIINRAEIVHWVSESNCPFKIVEDQGFLSLMKTGYPGYYVLSASTVAQDVKLVFGWTQERIAKTLKLY